MNYYKVIGVIFWIALIGFGGCVTYLTHVYVDAVETANDDIETGHTFDGTIYKATSYLVFVILFCAGMMMYSAMDFMAKL